MELETQTLGGSLIICSLFWASSGKKKDTSEKLKPWVCSKWGYNEYFLNGMGNTGWEIGIKTSQKPLKSSVFCEQKKYKIDLSGQLKE